MLNRPLTAYLTRDASVDIDGGVYAEYQVCVSVGDGEIPSRIVHEDGGVTWTRDAPDSVTMIGGDECLKLYGVTPNGHEECLKLRADWKKQI